MGRWCVLATLTAVGLVAAPSAGAQTPQLPVGQADGVRLVREHGAIVIVFTARAERLWRRVAGRRVSVLCEERSGPDEFGFVTETGGGTTLRAAQALRRRIAESLGHPTRGLDRLLQRRSAARGGGGALGHRAAPVPRARRGRGHPYERAGLHLRRRVSFRGAVLWVCGSNTTRGSTCTSASAQRSSS
jgi:hypothetical protein